MAIHTCQRSQPTANSLQVHAHGEFAGTLHSLSLVPIRKTNVGIISQRIPEQMDKLKNLIYSSTIILLSCNLTPNQIAREKIEFHLAKIENYLTGIQDSSLTYIESISFLEEYSGVISESDGTYIGKINPTEEDLRKWKNWYELNQEKFIWDEQARKIITRKQ